MVGSKAASYKLHPEVVESVFYMYRITGEKYWQDVAWHLFETINEKTWTEFGNAEIANVFAEEAVKVDHMESFWLAETLKYLYLIFCEPGVLSLDDWVLNTEAHPFRIPKR